MAIKASSQVTIIDVTDAYSVTLTSETYTFMGDTTGAPAGLSCTTQAVAYRGDQICSVEVSKIQCPSGITAEVADDEGNVGSVDDEGNVVFTDDEGNVVTKRITSPTIKFTTTDTIEEACAAVITTKVDDVTIDKKFSFAVAKTGAQGEQGVAGNGIGSVVRYYKLATSTPSTPTTNPPDGWATTQYTYPLVTGYEGHNSYFTDCTTYTDGTFAFSSVALESIYATAKQKAIMTGSMLNSEKNLIINGDGSMLDNTNFSDAKFLTSDSLGIGSFAYQASRNGVFYTYGQKYLDNYISIVNHGTYDFSVQGYAKNNTIAAEQLRILFKPYDADTNEIYPGHVSWVNGTTTELTQDLNDGDTIVYLNSVEQFETTTTKYTDGLIFWDYTDTYGQTYEAETYSRNVYTGLWTDATAAIDITNNTITLSTAWSGGTKTAGTSVSQSSDKLESSYIVVKTDNSALSYLEWRTVTAAIEGVGTNWEDGKFPHGTKYIIPGLHTRAYAYFANISLVSRDVSNLLTRVTEAETSITTNKNAIELKAEKTEVATVVDKLTSDINGVSNDLSNYVKNDDDYQSITKSVSTLTQTADDFTMKFEKINSEIGSEGKYIRYSDEGIEIGDPDDESKPKLTLDNTGINFAKDGKVLGSWDGDYFYTGNMYVRTDEQARFGDFAFIPYGDGSLAFVRVGE